MGKFGQKGDDKFTKEALPLWRTKCLRNIKNVFIYCKVRATLAELLTSHQEGLSLPFFVIRFSFHTSHNEYRCHLLVLGSMDVCCRNLSAISLCKYGLGLHH